MNIFTIVISEKAKRDLRKVPAHIAIKFYEWIETVGADGLKRLVLMD